MAKKKKSKATKKSKSAKSRSAPKATKMPAMTPRMSYRPDTTWAFVASLPIIGYILAAVAKRRDDYVMYYARQGLALGIIFLAVHLILMILVITIPLIFVWNIVVLILWIISVRNALSGTRRPTPLVGWLADKF